MKQNTSYFFCGIGGSGMLPLACIVRAQGHDVGGSDRSFDQGRTPEKFDYLMQQGIHLFPQDGSGLHSASQTLVTSAAVEDDIPDVKAARRLGAAHLTRPQLLARLMNDAPFSLAIGGTSGKSTTTGMVAWILHQSGRDPVVMNGAVMKNFVTATTPFASALAGKGAIFVSEVDESDGSIALYRPTVAVLNNISIDHKSMDELRTLFFNFIEMAEHAVVNADDDESARLADRLPASHVTRFSLRDDQADVFASNIVEEPLAISMLVTEKSSGSTVPLRLSVPGRHNAANALAALASVRAAGVPLKEAITALAGFTGLRRRFDIVGTADGITVIDDFGHNPDKIAATLKALRAFPGRLLVLFQPHGFGPLAKMRNELIEAFADHLGEEDVLTLPDPVYFGGTVSRDVTSADIVDGVREKGLNAHYYPSRDDAARYLTEIARTGDRIIIMGARDDTLSELAKGILTKLQEAPQTDA